jgi:hypothetical protein
LSKIYFEARPLLEAPLHWFPDKNNPAARRLGCGAKNSFLGGFEKGYLRTACHSKPSMVERITGSAREINVGFRKVCIETSRRVTVQRHTPTLHRSG